MGSTIRTEKNCPVISRIARTGIRDVHLSANNDELISCQPGEQGGTENRNGELQMKFLDSVFSVRPFSAVLRLSVSQ